ncbi:hypothetical protein ACUIAJ_04845 [Dermabacteraceae bacterium CCM 9519]
MPRRGEISLDELIAQTGVSAAEVTSALARLNLVDAVLRRAPGGTM